MINRPSRDAHRLRIHKRIRAKVAGDAARPRLAVFRSIKHITVQVIDDRKGHTLVAASSQEKDAPNGGNLAGAKALGKLIASRCQEKGIKSVVFDRGGYLYHGRVKALADAAREGGLEF
ncbi:MAG: 50S ribosomal protein L18 [Acidobacteria bacterium]|nr:50S ribosomal protein L18 [Acidobacteriota bacterium]